ncbi:hypothetical protein BH18ACI5_BH18ACI5_28260 [soil metagenome]
MVQTPTRIRIVLVGDSTVTDRAGWGLGFKRFAGAEVDCINVAAGGRSSRSYIDEGKWKDALALKGDYYLIQFGHNDEPGRDPSAKPTRRRPIAHSWRATSTRRGRLERSRSWSPRSPGETSKVRRSGLRWFPMWIP